jgi:hypothetical protein
MAKEFVDETASIYGREILIILDGGFSVYFKSTSAGKWQLLMPFFG